MKNHHIAGEKKSTFERDGCLHFSHLLVARNPGNRLRICFLSKIRMTPKIEPCKSIHYIEYINCVLCCVISVHKNKVKLLYRHIRELLDRHFGLNLTTNNFPIGSLYGNNDFRMSPTPHIRCIGMYGKNSIAIFVIIRLPATSP